jgi:hypothetical protein
VATATANKRIGTKTSRKLGSGLEDDSTGRFSSMSRIFFKKATDIDFKSGWFTIAGPQARPLSLKCENNSGPVKIGDVGTGWPWFS